MYMLSSNDFTVFHRFVLNYGFNGGLELFLGKESFI